MDAQPSALAPVRSYFVDEAGDAVLFDRKGRVIVGTPGCSRFFILGLLDIQNPDLVGHELEDLRSRLLADPYFSGVPSMQPQARKTALAFHAKNDLPEVRREVFSLLLRHEMRFFAVVRDKAKVLGYARQRRDQEPSYRHDPNELYDSLVRTLFRERLHQDSHYQVYFARRGRRTRTGALMAALRAAREKLAAERGIRSDAPIDVTATALWNCPGLQTVDYFLWALQRLYERREERFVAFLWQHFRLIHDMDDNREAQGGVFYAQKKPLTVAALGKLPGV